MKYQALDVVLLRPENGARFYVIVDEYAQKANTYIGARLERAPLTKRYLIPEEQILTKVGRLEPMALEFDNAALELAPPPDWELGQAYARVMASRAASEHERSCWALLGTLKPGDPVGIHPDFSLRDCIHGNRFHQVLLSGKRFVFAAVTRAGKIYRYPLEALMMAPASAGTAPPDQGRRD